MIIHIYISTYVYVCMHCMYVCAYACVRLDTVGTNIPLHIHSYIHTHGGGCEWQEEHTPASGVSRHCFLRPFLPDQTPTLCSEPWNVEQERNRRRKRERERESQTKTRVSQSGVAPFHTCLNCYLITTVTSSLAFQPKSLGNHHLLLN